MKRNLVVLIIINSLLVPLNAEAAVKSGSACKKVNQLLTLNGKKYICTKSGKKLVWKINGKPKNSPTPPEAIDKVQEIQPAVEPAVETKTEPISIENLDINQIYFIAAAAVNSKTTLTTSGTNVFKIYQDPKVDVSFVERQNDLLLQANAYWKNIFNPEVVTILYWDTYDSSSIDWANSIYEPIRGQYNAGRKLSDCSSGNASAMNFLTNGQDRYVITVCSAKETSKTSDFKLIHEYVHLVQFSQHLIDYAPHWAIEGGADYFGQVLGLLPQSKQLMDQHRAKLKRNAEMSSPIAKSEEDFLREMFLLQATNGGDVQKAYLYGSLATEVLIALYGVEKYEEFLQKFKSLKNGLISPERSKFSLDDFFRDTYGIDLELFYRKLYPYVMKQVSIK